MPGQTHLVAIAASAGGVHALLDVATGLAPRFPAVVCAVLHVGTGPTNVGPARDRRGVDGLPGRRHGRLRATKACGGRAVVPSAWRTDHLRRRVEGLIELTEAIVAVEGEERSGA